MKILTIIAMSLTFSLALADSFEIEAKQLAHDLKSNLMKNLSEKISKDGPVEAIPFCHANIKPIAKEAAKNLIAKYEFGRTSHKIRNPGNKPAEWMGPYIQEFQGKFKGQIKKPYIIHKLENSKRVYLEPLYVEAKCMLCHGDSVTKDVKDKILQIYPQDKATGFKLGEFRGFIWVKEK